MKNNYSGLTLIEVLIALVIITIALTAIIKSTAQSIRNTRYIETKTLATWVGMEKINEASLSLIKPPTQPEKQVDEVEMLGQSWTAETYLAPTPNPKIQEINVNVKQNPDGPVIIHLLGYFYAAS